MTCSLCDRPIKARGWCAGHYRRWERYGDPKLGGPVRERAKVLMADVEELAGYGEALPAVATRLGTTPIALERRLYRHHRGDLVSRMKGTR